jgi:S-adenosylmethionine:tRNA ribosyltransferase-isomerase
LETPGVRTDLFDFELPDSAIALYPAHPRDSARMLVVHAVDGSCALADADLADRSVRDLASLLMPGDALVLNDTRVIPAALAGTRTRAGVAANVSFNLTKRVDAHRWRAFARPAKRLEAGDRVQLGVINTACLMGALDATVSDKGEAGDVELTFDLSGAALDAAIAAAGVMPLPPYIALKRAPDDRDRASYQTIYAEKDGAVAAPTAGLHFTPELFAALEARGVSKHFVTLHVGAGTFLPVKADDTADHNMHAEWGEVSAETAAALNAVKARGGRIVCVGTTSLRLLESAAGDDGTLQSWSGDTAIFITPGYRFKCADVLMTNFHLPRSTLFMLVSAFCGLGTMRAAYGHAIQHGYRFYSYGDACLLFRDDAGSVR